MYTEKLIDAYKEHMNYVQYKQVASDLGISVQMLTEIRKGRAFLKENLALMIADTIGEEQETVLIGLAADKAKTPQEQALWANIAKKFNGRGLQGLSMACGGLMLWIGSPNEALAKCALCILC
ncbi:MULTISPECIES: DUF3693 domain-containing protein [Vibrio]|uniref:DUF3693 domain-containing protein n=1 Tax=Vibrio TaxID=662 RepID=UPI0020755C85|nr:MULTISPECIES: DUF3693 domain-containing protein [Vibrio]USD33947.1 hypothetical protein J8Z27_07630 [Vibrio sp. SCSIO 43186]USD44217.1 hypothetical protein J4N38_08015 [Vibrio sp. SCSIO 43145]USD71071.1 hypothetical protein J4N41_07635 [Vibrio sp. SCSIO 43139]USD95977.1 hypothetical protein CTT30_07740 [Vibrio coralliilyticus]